MPSTSKVALVPTSNEYVRDRSHDYFMALEELNEDEVLVVDEADELVVEAPKHSNAQILLNIAKDVAYQEKRLKEFSFLRKDNDILYCVYCRTHGSDKQKYGVGHHFQHRNNLTDKLKAHAGSAQHICNETRYLKRKPSTKRGLKQKIATEKVCCENSTKRKRFGGSL